MSRKSKPAPGHASRGFTLLELAVAGAVIGILAAVLLSRLLRYQELAEKTAMETTVVNMRSGLRARVAELIIQGRTDEIGALGRENPIGWLDAPPANYAGELDRPGQGAVRPGYWYFDGARRELVYLPHRNRHLKPGPDGTKAIRFRVTTMTRQDETGPAPVLAGAAITPVVPYDWPVF